MPGTGLFLKFVSGRRCSAVAEVGRDNDMTDATKPKDYDKRNDPSWCMGILGIIGGGLMIVLNLSDIVVLITKHLLSFSAVCCFLIGVQSYLTWRWKQKYLKLVFEFDRSVESLSTLLAEMSTDIERIK